MEITISSANQNYIKKLIEEGDYSKMEDILNEAIHLHESFRKQSFKDLQKQINKGINSKDSTLSVSDIIKQKTSHHKQ